MAANPARFHTFAGEICFPRHLPVRGSPLAMSVWVGASFGIDAR